MAESPKYRIAIIGSGPIGKLLLSSVASHPRISYVTFESDTLPLRPSFGYGVGPQTLNAALRLNPTIGKELHEKCIITPVWMHFYHGGREEELPTIEVPSGEYGRLGRQELLDLLDSYRPAGCETLYGKTLQSITKEETGLKLVFQDGVEERVNAVYACDGMNSICRKYIQGQDFTPATYSGHVAFRGKIPSQKIEATIGKQFTDTYMFIGVKRWHILIFPIAGGSMVNIAAFAMEDLQKKRGRNYKTSTEELLSYFPGANSTVQKLLRVFHPSDCL
jgi:salicylate hydroxylase